jgi:hypothetical protein
VLYPLSFGPFTGLRARGLIPDWLDEPVNVLYEPIVAAYNESEIAHSVIHWYVALFVPKDNRPET